MSEDVIVDVRPLLERGEDPLRRVVSHAAGVGTKDRLILVAPFNPLPLRRVLAQMGFSSRAEKVCEREWQVSLVRDGRGEVEGPPTPEDCAGLPDPGAPVHRAADGVHIDLRDLTPPLPMLAILRLCAAMPAGEAVIAQLDRDPIYLYPELAEIGWTAGPLAVTPDGPRLVLRREEA